MTTLINIKIWNGSDAVLDADAIEIADGRIVRLGTSGELAGKHSRDLAGAFVIPGLIDAHVHMCLNPEITNPADQDKPERETLLGEMQVRAETMLKAGITTARDLGGGQWLELALRDLINRERVLGTRLLCSGQPVTSPGGHCHFWGGEAADVTEARAVIARQLEHDVDLIKVMATGGNLTKGSKPADAQFDEPTLRAIVEEASSHGFHVAAHCHGTSGIANAARAGVTTIEHCSWVGKDGWAKHFDAEVCKDLVEAGAFVSPTINLGWQRRVGSGEYESLVQGNFSAMRSMGARFIASTDAGIPNVFHADLPKALPLFSHFTGLDNEAVLRAATSDCAEAIGLGETIGRLAPGYVADMVILDGDPLEDLAVLATPVDVISAGRSVAGIAES